MPLRRHPYTTSALVLDKVISEIAEGIEERNGAGGFRLRLPFALDPHDSPLALEVYEQWSRSPSPDLPSMGLTGMVVAGDAAALAQIEWDAPAFANSPAIVALNGAVLGFRKNDPVAVAALGRMATSPQSPFRQSAIGALKNIHSRETVPYLGDCSMIPNLFIVLWP